MPMYNITYDSYEYIITVNNCTRNFYPTEARPIQYNYRILNTFHVNHYNII